MKRLVIAALLALGPVVALGSTWYTENPKNEHCEKARQVAKAMGIPAMVSPVTMRLWAIEHERHYHGVRRSQTRHISPRYGVFFTWHVDVSGYNYFDDINSCRRYYQSARREGLTVGPTGRWIFHKPKLTKIATNQRLSALFGNQIGERVKRHWRPVFAPTLNCRTRIDLSPQGQLEGPPIITHPSGNAKFDAAVIAAIEAAAPFTPPIGLSYSEFKVIRIDFSAKELSSG